MEEFGMKNTERKIPKEKINSIKNDWGGGATIRSVWEGPH